jgi:hypothetical protein
VILLMNRIRIHNTLMVVFTTLPTLGEGEILSCPAFRMQFLLAGYLFFI